MKKTWNQYVREKMQAQKIKQDDIADEMGKTQGAIGHWLTGRRTPNVDEVAKMLDITGVDKVILNSDGTVEDFDSNVSIVNFKKPRAYPLLSPIQAGIWRGINMLSGEEGYEMIPSATLASQYAFYLRIEGKSMEPKFSHGDLVLIDPQLAPTPGCFVAAINGDNEATFKQYKELGILSENGIPHFELIPLNPLFPILSSLTQEIRIIGVAVEKIEAL